MPFDFARPDYSSVFQQRIDRLHALRSGRASFNDLRSYYKSAGGPGLADYITDWGITFDPRNVSDETRPSYLPFILWQRQREWVEWFYWLWRSQQDGACEKSREMGVSWLAVAACVSLSTLHDGMQIGFGSRKEEYVDKLGDPKSIFYKVRAYVENLPQEFAPGWSRKNDAPHMRIAFPHNGSVITGESGDNIGRGDRQAIYIIDESAYLERPHLIEASLSQTTRCRIDISSANGTANPFFEKRTKWAGTRRLFTFHWRDDPRKDETWYANEVENRDSVVVAQEIDIDYSASVEGVLIPSAWVQAAIGASEKLNIEITGSRYAALDVGDERDKNAMADGHGIEIVAVDEWSGKGSDTFATAARAVNYCDDHGIVALVYDSDGLGASIRGDVRRINEDRKATGRPTVETVAFRGSEAVLNPERQDEPGRLNKDFFRNRKAQTWWATRKRFERTWRAVTQGVQYDPALLVSLHKNMKNLTQIAQELSQITFSRQDSGHLVIDKTPDGAKSPNKADAINMRLNSSIDNSSSFFSREKFLHRHEEAIAVPRRCDLVFATMVSVSQPGHDNDGTGVVFWARNRFVRPPLVVLDWELVEIEPSVIVMWLPRIMERLQQLNQECNSMQLGPLMIENNELGQAIVVAAQRKWTNVRPIEYPPELDMNAAPRALNASAHVAEDKIKLAATALGKTCDFKGIEKNHLLAQLQSFAAGSKESEQAVLLNAFTHGVALGIEQ
jgi:hypothetical protein